MNKRRGKNQEGFTLLELMIVISIIGIMVAPVLYLEIQSLEHSQAGIFRRDLAEAGSLVMDRIAQDVRWSVAVPGEAGGADRPADRLVLGLPDGTFAAYRLDQQQHTLTRERLGPDAKTVTGRDLLARHVRSFEAVPDTQGPPRLITVRIGFHRELLNIPVDFALKSVCVRRLP